MPPKNVGKQSIEELQRRWQKLHHAKIEAETQLKGARERLDELKREAMEKFGADDLDRLRQMLSEMQQENERRRGEYQTSLDEIEASLRQVEEDFDRVDPAGSASKERSS